MNDPGERPPRPDETQHIPPSEIPTRQMAPPDRVDLEQQAISRAEYITAMVHFYRGEMHRATAWRLRLDNTTNWAIISAGGLLTFSFGQPESGVIVLLLGQVLLFSFLWVESRRYRFFDVWRSRVRKIEENFYNPILTRQLISPDPLWGDIVARDLAQPKFKMSRWHALHRRLHANYLTLFAVLTVATVAKLFLHPLPTHSVSEASSRLAVGPLPAWAMFLLVSLFYLTLTLLYVIPGSATVIRGRQWGMGDEDVEEEER